MVDFSGLDQGRFNEEFLMVVVYYLFVYTWLNINLYYYCADTNYKLFSVI